MNKDVPYSFKNHKVLNCMKYLYIFVYVYISLFLNIYILLLKLIFYC